RPSAHWGCTAILVRRSTRSSWARDLPVYAMGKRGFLVTVQSYSGKVQCLTKASTRANFAPASPPQNWPGVAGVRRTRNDRSKVGDFRDIGNQARARS